MAYATVYRGRWPGVLISSGSGTWPSSRRADQASWATRGRHWRIWSGASSRAIRWWIAAPFCCSCTSDGAGPPALSATGRLPHSAHARLDGGAGGSAARVTDAGRLDAAPVPHRATSDAVSVARPHRPHSSPGSRRRSAGSESGRIARRLAIATAVLVLPLEFQAVVRRSPLEPSAHFSHSCCAAARAVAAGRPGYIFARTLPAWIFYSTDWERPDTSARPLSDPGGHSGGPRFENAPSRGRVRAGEVELRPLSRRPRASRSACPRAWSGGKLRNT